MTDRPDLPADDDIWTDAAPASTPDAPASEAADPDTGAATDAPFDAQRRWPLQLGVAALAVGCLGLGFVVGSLRSTTDRERGASPTTSIVTQPAGGATFPVTPTTASTAPGEPTGPDAGAPPVPTITQGVGFDEGLPASVGDATLTVSPGWAVVDEHVVPPADDPLPDDAAGPRLPGEGPQLSLELAAPVGVATVRLVTPTGHSGIAVSTEGDGAWQLVVAPDLDELRLYEVRDGVAEQRAYLQQAIPAETSIGLYAADGGVGVVIDGEPVRVETFFGLSFVVEGDRPLGTSLALVVGSGAPAFDDVAFG